jgi:NB-ARC domain/Domain of unknown function (DUF4062)
VSALEGTRTRPAEAGPVGATRGAVFVSSTGRDLGAYREAAIATCLKLGLFPIGMEFFEAMGAGATAGSKEKLESADVYVGIFAHRYGFIEQGYEKSVTEVEFDLAGERNLERLCFLVDPAHLWPVGAIDFENHELLERFKGRVEQSTIRALFTTVDDFGAKLMHALVEWKERHPHVQAAQAPAQAVDPTALAAAAPPEPALVVGRDQDIVRLKDRLGVPSRERRRRLTVIRGWPGVGKTTLVTTLAHDPEIAAAFPDGLLWASIGEQPDPRAELSAWRRALTRRDVAAPSETLEDLAAQVRGLLADKRMLLILDDVWETAAAAPFSVAGSGCATLVTTRFADVARELAVTADDIYVLGQLGDDEGFELLRRLAPTLAKDYAEKSRSLVRDLEGLPLAILVAGRLLEDEAARGWGVDDLLDELAQGARLLEEQAPADRFDPVTQAIPTVATLLRRSTDRLDAETRERFAYLGAFAPKPATFDLDAMRAVWVVEDAKPTARKLTDRGLLEPIKETGRFQMHALLVMHAQSLLEV